MKLNFIDGNLLLIAKFGNIFIMFIHPYILFLYQNSNNLTKYNSIKYYWIHICIHYILLKINNIYIFIL